MLEQIQQFLLHYFTWWNGANFNTRFYTRRFGVLVGHDEFGNAYYRRPGIDPALGFERRWVIYNGVAEASMTPPGWNGWLHHTVDAAADRGRLQAPPVAIAAYGKPDRHAGRDPARRLDAEGRPTPAHRGRLRGLESRPLRRAAFIPPPFSSKAPAMDLFRLAVAIGRRARPTIMSPRLALAALAAVAALTATPRVALADKISNPIAVFDGLDKITGRIISFEVAINETVQFGALQITPRVCYSRPPTDAPQTDAFAQVDEIDELKQIKRIFSGWMFADSPGLHGVEHPIFDIWLTACKGGTVVIHDAPAAEASAPNPDESPPTDPGADAASPEQPAPPPVQPAKKKKPKPPTVLAAPDTQPTAPFEPAPDPSSSTGNARAR